MKRLQNKVAVVTGGNSGIGKGIAKHFLQEGAKVVIFGRNLETLNEAKAEMGNQVLAIQGDVTQHDDLKKLFQETEKHYGKIDSLIVNSGVADRVHLSKATEDQFDHMVDINYRGAYFTVHYALDHLKPGASVIMISSCVATITIKNHSIYSSTKAATVKLTKNFACDLADRKIRVNSISPGYVETPIFAERLKTDPDYLKRKEAGIPLKRIGQPEDIAHAALFLSSDEASYITGVDLLVDGGYAVLSLEP
jgi:NAD(P)-dependent dehydrogenase (short-subunit alcohol dehydrogenase family)